MDAKDIEILQLESGKPYLLGTGSFGTVRLHGLHTAELGIHPFLALSSALETCKPLLFVYT